MEGGCSREHLVFGAKGEDMDHQTLLWAHYSLQKARTFPRSQKQIKKDDSDFTFFFANGIYFFSSKRMVLDQVETVSHLDWIISGSSQPDVIAVLCLTGTMDSGKISHQFRQSDFHSHVDQIWCFYCCSWQWECMASCYDHRLDNSSQHNEEL